MLRYGRPAPDYTMSDATSVVLIMPESDADIAFLEMILRHEELTGTAMPIDSLIILSRLRQKRRLTTADLISDTQKSEQATRTALEKLVEDHELIYNLGNGRGYSVRQVIDTVKKVSGKDFKVVETGRREGDPAVLTADATRAENELGWAQQLPELETIVESAWKWHSEHPDGYQD